MPTNYAQALEELAAEIYQIAESKGFWDSDSGDDFLTIPTKLALVHSEVSEALETYRGEYDDADQDLITFMTPMQEDDFTEELADIIIRVLDLAAAFELPLGSILLSKVEENKTRPPKHGKRL